jgi:hypothetical protein
MSDSFRQQQPKPYQVLIHKEIYERANTYLTDLAVSKSAEENCVWLTVATVLGDSHRRDDCHLRISG